MPGLYTKLITVDKVDLLVGPYGTNFVAPAMPTIIQNKKMVISYTAIGINRQYNYDKYFSMVPVGSDGVNAFSKGFFEMAAAQDPEAADRRDHRRRRRVRPEQRPRARARSSRSTASSSIYDKSYPPSTTDYTPVMRAVQAANADIVYVGAYPPDNVGLMRAANEIGLTPKMFGGAHDRHAGHADQGAARPDPERPRHLRELRALAEAATSRASTI